MLGSARVLGLEIEQGTGGRDGGYAGDEVRPGEYAGPSSDVQLPQ